MAKRKSVRRFDTDEVQGEGSYVVMTAFKVKEIRAARQAKREQGDDFDGVEAGVQALRTHLVEWNWVDDNDQPLPKPQDEPSVIDDLTSDEAEFLANLLVQGLSETDAGN